MAKLMLEKSINIDNWALILSGWSGQYIYHHSFFIPGWTEIVGKKIMLQVGHHSPLGS